MDSEQSTKNFIENDFKFMTIGEVAKELVDSRRSILGLKSQVDHLQNQLNDALEQTKAIKNEKRALEQELAELKSK